MANPKQIKSGMKVYILDWRKNIDSRPPSYWVPEMDEYIHKTLTVSYVDKYSKSVHVKECNFWWLERDVRVVSALPANNPNVLFHRKQRVNGF